MPPGTSVSRIYYPTRLLFTLFLFCWSERASFCVCVCMYVILYTVFNVKPIPTLYTITASITQWLAVFVVLVVQRQVFRFGQGFSLGDDLVIVRVANSTLWHIQIRILPFNGIHTATIVTLLHFYSFPFYSFCKYHENVKSETIFCTRNTNCINYLVKVHTMQ